MPVGQRSWCLPVGDPQVWPPVTGKLVKRSAQNFAQLTALATTHHVQTWSQYGAPTNRYLFHFLKIFNWCLRQAPSSHGVSQKHEDGSLNMQKREMGLLTPWFSTSSPYEIRWNGRVSNSTIYVNLFDVWHVGEHCQRLGLSVIDFWGVMRRILSDR